ncbi:type I toxin-antitoxin system SymE family toxin [Erwinia psidii]|uniref:SymE family type I addiction module toxin n=1 Tax=Erwinia psidii TaxID=69224 RepID=UPI00226B346C|nr:SymE family type I addiction module toxin [Erwinia psidii]MCX8963977.1 type I toxin-antitoxin system SymE family toxin [Erwinia psidii]
MGYIRDQRKFEPSPSITLRGHWLEEAGFETGKKVEVLCELGELIIRQAEE